jgi:hypothetical protein
MSHPPFDTYSKDLFVTLLAPHGSAQSDRRIPSDPQYADVYFVPAAGAVAASPHQGFVHRLASAGRAIFEMAHQPPDLAEMVSWQRKQFALWQSEQNAARRAKKPYPPLPPVLWGLSSGPPEAAMASYRMTPMDDTLWPSGCYDAAPDGTFRLVVISQLPRSRDTLLVRTLGRGVTFEQAMEDLEALEPDAPEHAVVGPFLASLFVQLQNDPTDEAHAMISQSMKIYEKLVRQWRNEGRDEGRDEGRKEGLHEGLRDAILDVCAARSLALTEAQRVKLAAETDPAVLRRWHTRAVTAASAAELFADAG